MKQTYEVMGQSVEAWLRKPGQETFVCTDQSEQQAALNETGAGEYTLMFDGRSERIWLQQKGDEIHIHARGASYCVRSQSALEASGVGAGSSADASVAPMPGTVVSINCQPGDQVEKNQTLMVIESMKMETAINAGRDGIVSEIHYAVADTFDRGVTLVTLEAIEE